jgi:hypothetical protein
MAVEMAKLSLWLITLQKNRPFTFLDHALRCGDSLLGVTDAKQIEYFHLDPKEGNQIPIVATTARTLLQEAIALRKELESFSVIDIQDLQRKEQLLQEAEEALDRVRFIGDLLVGEALVQSGKTEELTVLSQQVAGALTADTHERDRRIEVLRAKAQRMLDLGKPSYQPPRKTFHWALEFPEAFLKDSAPKGFSAIVGNPPFMGGTVASTALGEVYMHHLHSQYQPWHGKADLVGLFVKTAFRLIQASGFIGMLATASLIRGETVESTLVPLLQAGVLIYRARSPFAWPGQANVTAVSVWLSESEWKGDVLLDDLKVENIAADLEPTICSTLEPYTLQSSCLPGYLGIKLSPSNVFLDREEVEQLPENIRAALLATVGGEELYRNISFAEGLYSFEPSLVTQEILEEYYQQYNNKLCTLQVEHSAPAKELCERLLVSKLAFACAETTHVQLGFLEIPTQGIIPKHKIIVFPSDSWAEFSILQSSYYDVWAWKYGIRRKEDLVFSPKRCSRTFPLPVNFHSKQTLVCSQVEDVGQEYYKQRFQIMCISNGGLTKTYKRFHNPDETASDIQKLRQLHAKMDWTVAAAYGWTDLNLGHDFRETKQGLRYTISESARREVLDRLLQLNHQRYAEEVAAGLHEKRKKGKAGSSKKAKAKVTSGQKTLF